MKLQLTRPIAFIDLETTGVTVSTDRIVEIAIVKISPDGSKVVKRKLVNPLMPIPAGASAVHGISDEMVKDAPTFKQIANEVKQFLENCDLGGYNSNRFDIPMLIEEFLRAGIEFSIEGTKLVDVQKVFHMMEQRTLSAAYKFYCSKVLEGAHGAEVDAAATYEILEAQLDKYQDLQNDVKFLADFSQRSVNADLIGRIIFDENGVEVFNFGKHKGKSVEKVLEIEPGYYSWMMNGDFPLYTKKVLKEIRDTMR